MKTRQNSTVCCLGMPSHLENLEGKSSGDLYKTQKGKVEAFPGPLGNQVYLFLKLGNGYMGI